MDKNKILFLNSSFIKSDSTPSADGSTSFVTISGYASTADVDRQGDVVPPSVWAKGMENYLKNPIILAYHDHSEPIGRMVEHKVDEKGLWIKAKISSAAKSVFNLIKDEVLTAFSIGFRIVDAEYNAAQELFVIKELELHEISVVSVPANQNTLFSLSKAFDDAEEFKSFKLQFAPKSESAKGLESSTEANGDITKEWKMDPKELEKLLADTATKAAEQTAKAIAESQAKAVAEKAQKEAQQAEFDAKVKAAVAAATNVTTGETGAERLLAEVEKRLAVQEESSKSALAGLEAALKEKASEIEAITKSRMQFGDTQVGGAMSAQDKEKAVILAKMAGKSLEGTKFGRQMVEKYGAHVPSATWELEVSLNLEAEVRRRLVVAPLFRNIQMQTNVMTIPVNPEAGSATWVQNSNFGSAPATLGAAGGSAGNTATHAIKEITLNAYKVATNEYTAYEEEEDALIALMPIIRDGMIRRVARAVDKAFLLGAGSGADPVGGLATLATNSTGNLTTSTPSASYVANVAALRGLRKGLGVWGLDPQDVVFIVNTDTYYNLLEDTTFQTMNQVGTQATLLTGQIGQIGGSPVLVSGEFASAASGVVGMIAVAPSNFIVGNQRGLRIDTQELVETQRRVMVASLRTGFTKVTSNYGAGVTKMVYSA
ncbi:Prohead protease [uncultured Caudovirales phage]|uniref:Prohead protease n=1 Tax=uncultured Caudovirales phage TaxID=2100421 RepID=A0A6J7WTK4_9CAUD|nr:Prohead protease [uncultured Caudovirales phage]